MGTWVVSYKQIGTNEIKLAKLNANRWGDATDKAEKVIVYLNSYYMQYNQQFQLESVKSLDALEEWDI